MRKISEEVKIKVAKLYGEKNCRQIAEELGLSPTTIANILKEKGIKRDKFKTECKVLHSYSPEQVREYLNNHSVIQCEKYFNCNYSSIRIYLYKNNISYKITDNCFYKLVDKDKFCTYYSEHSLKEVCEHFNISESEAYIAKRKLGAKKIRCSRYHRKRISNKICSSNFLDIQKEMIGYLSEKYSSEDISIFLNKTPARISQILKEYHNGE